MEYDIAIEGDFELDRAFDGRGVTRPRGIIYITTGAGGARLHNPEQTSRPSTWQPFTAKYIADRHSFTVLDINDSTLSIRQIDEKGTEIDRVILTK